jgi:hypothetical protein
MGSVLEVCNGTFVDGESSASSTLSPTSAITTDQIATTETTINWGIITSSRTEQAPSGYRYGEWSFLPKCPTLSEDDPLLLPLISTPSPISQNLGLLTETTTATPTWPYGAWNLLAPPGEISLPPTTQTSTVILGRNIKESLSGASEAVSKPSGGSIVDNRMLRLYIFLTMIAASIILTAVLFEFC